MKYGSAEKWMVLLTALCGMLLPSCSFLPRDLTFSKGNLVSFGYQESFLQIPCYYTVEIGQADHPYRGEPAVSLRLPDGTLIRTDRFNADLLREKSERSIIDPPLRIDQQGWSKGIEEIRIGGYRFLVEGGKVVWFGVYAWINHKNVEPAPVIGDAEGSTFYQMPLTEAELTRLFGKPDRLSHDYGGPL